MSWLNDSVYSIRTAATINLQKLTEVFGAEWAKQTILPEVLAMAAHPNYLYRMTTISALTTMASAVTPQMIKESILPTIVGLISDPVPNIRFSVAKSLETLFPLLKASPETTTIADDEVKPALLQLSEDSDVDVKFFAERALMAS
ncbi:protein phosphatase 2A structural subunit [Basidiobolus ranarum]|uniref:Protein phosphatase 2A structural subunit n=1 Tax=Basidiobolus ranarum TaxID=34480 RepID=A0ABR2VNH2_9FUNG